MLHKATMVVIITEKLILEGVTEILEQQGATGYTLIPAGGKGSRGRRSPGRAAVVEAFDNVKIEAIVPDREAGQRIADAVAERFFGSYSGITYLEEVEILRPHKF